MGEPLWHVLVSDRVLKAHRARFLGKTTPVQLWWGSSDPPTAAIGRPADSEHWAAGWPGDAPPTPRSTPTPRPSRRARDRDGRAGGRWLERRARGVPASVRRGSGVGRPGRCAARLSRCDPPRRRVLGGWDPALDTGDADALGEPEKESCPASATSSSAAPQRRPEDARRDERRVAEKARGHDPPADGAPATPLPTGGVTHVFELITVLLGAMVLGRRTIWLPERFSAASRCTHTEKAIRSSCDASARSNVSRPRGVRSSVTAGSSDPGLIEIAFAIGAAVAPLLRPRHAPGPEPSSSRSIISDVAVWRSASWLTAASSSS